MDVMQLRRSLMMAIKGGASSVWSQKVITVPSNMTTASDVLTWLQSEMPSTYTLMCCLRDNVDMSTWNQDDFIFTGWGNLQSTTNAMQYQRVRGVSGDDPYFQNRNYSNNETTNVYQGETFTIFYQ